MWIHFFISPWPSEIQGNIFLPWLVYVVGFARDIYIYIYIGRKILHFERHKQRQFTQ